jgi:hypothetical protein
MPSSEPIPPKITEENERRPDPQRNGIRLPTVEPINNPIQMSGLLFIYI